MVTDILIAFIFALVLAILLLPTRPGRRTSRSGALVYAMLVLFPVTLAGGLWLVPIGQPIWGSYWLGFLLVALFTALILMAAAGPPIGDVSERPTRQAAREAEQTETAVAAFGFFIWVLLVASAVAVFLAYVAGGPPPNMVDPIAVPG